MDVSLAPISAGLCEEAFDFLQNGATWRFMPDQVAAICGGFLL